MAEPLIETAALALVARLEQITEANGYSADVAGVVRPTRRADWWNASTDQRETVVQDGMIIVIQGDRRQPEEPGVHGMSEWVQTFELHRIVEPSSSSETPIDTLINYAVADIEKAVNSTDWRTEGMVDARVVGDSQLPEGPACDGRTVQIEIHYRHLYGDPTSAGA